MSACSSSHCLKALQDRPGLLPAPRPIQLLDEAVGQQASQKYQRACAQQPISTSAPGRVEPIASESSSSRQEAIDRLGDRKRDGVLSGTLAGNAIQKPRSLVGFGTDIYLPNALLSVPISAPGSLPSDAVRR